METKVSDRYIATIEEELVKAIIAVRVAIERRDAFKDKLRHALEQRAALSSKEG